MNTNRNKEESLDALLHEWKVSAPLPPRFQQEVWLGIARAGDKTPPAFWRPWAAWLEACFSRPTLALSYVAVLLATGVITGVWQVKDRAAQNEARWQARYVQSIDPYRMHHN